MSLSPLENTNAIRSVMAIPCLIAQKMFLMQHGGWLLRY